MVVFPYECSCYTIQYAASCGRGGNFEDIGCHVKIIAASASSFLREKPRRLASSTSAICPNACQNAFKGVE